MQPVFVDTRVRRRVLGVGALTALAAAAGSVLAAQLTPASVAWVLVALLIGICVLAGVAAASLLIQQSLLERSPALTPLRVARWGGTMLAVIAGPLVTAKLLVGAIALAGALLVEVDGAGAYAGVGIAWLILPMALLVTGTAALKLPAVAADAPIDTGAAITLANGREWSLVPLGIALTLTFLMLAAGTLLLATGRLWGLLPLVAGGVAFAPAVAALARRWQGLAGRAG